MMKIVNIKTVFGVFGAAFFGLSSLKASIIDVDKPNRVLYFHDKALKTNTYKSDTIELAAKVEYISRKYKERNVLSNDKENSLKFQLTDDVLVNFFSNNKRDLEKIFIYDIFDDIYE